MAQVVVEREYGRAGVVARQNGRQREPVACTERKRLCVVFVLVAAACVGISRQPAQALGLDVQRGVVPAPVVAARRAVFIVLNYLRSGNNVGGHVLYHEAVRLARKQVAPVYQQLVHGLSAVRHVAAFAHAHARQLFKYVAYAVFKAVAEVACVKLHGVAGHLYSRVSAFHDNLAQRPFVVLHHNVGAFGHDSCLYLAVFISQTLCLHPHVAARFWRYAVRAVLAGYGVAFHRRRQQAVGIQQHRDAGHGLSLQVFDVTADYGLGMGRHAYIKYDNKQKFSFHRHKAWCDALKQ